jgi:hypothetical protein
VIGVLAQRKREPTSILNSAHDFLSQDSQTTNLTTTAKMGRGPKKHQKRLSAPSHWLLDKLSGMFDLRTARAIGAATKLDTAILKTDIS